MSNFLGKKYKLDSSDKFDEYMEALGVNMVLRKIGNMTSSTLQLLEKDGMYTLRITSTWKSQDMPFQSGVEFNEVTPDGRKVKTVMTVEGNKLTQYQTGEQQDTAIVRTFSDTDMVAVFTVDDVVCTRKYKVID